MVRRVGDGVTFGGVGGLVCVEERGKKKERKKRGVDVFKSNNEVRKFNEQVKQNSQERKSKGQKWKNHCRTAVNAENMEGPQ